MADLSVVPMGGDGFDERVFKTLVQVRAHGGELWWLWLARCSACEQRWLVAQDERIYDNFYLRRLTAAEAQTIVESDVWPAEFLTFEQVLAAGRSMSTPCRFFDPFADSLVWTVQDLRKQRPGISALEIGGLLGLSPTHARTLYWRARLSTGRSGN